MLDAITKTGDGKDLRSFDSELFASADNVSSHVSKLIVKIDAIKDRLEKVEDALRKSNEAASYIPSDYEGWFDSLTSSKQARDLRAKWLQTVDSRSRRLRWDSCENEIENLCKEYKIFKKAVGQFNLATESLMQRENEIVCRWRSALQPMDLS